jgi:hypothetical protein
VWIDAVQQPSASVATADGYQPEILFGATNQIGMWRYDNAVGTRIGALTNLAANIVAADRLGVEVIATGHGQLVHTAVRGVGVEAERHDQPVDVLHGVAVPRS